MSQAPGAGPRPFRTSVERVSEPALVRLSHLPRALPFVAMLALIVAGLLAGGIPGCALIVVGVLFLVWLLYLGWPVFNGSERLMRLAVVALGLALAVIQLFPHH